ncbi:hypothetical protein JHK87_052253 [Glycine soja]|nr:hypothetical protein JHK87_052253 [Glycine soja]
MKKGLLIVLLIIQIHYNVVVNGNELESEFSFDSHVARMLYDVSLSVSGKTGNRYNKAVRCPQSKGYRSCLPSRNGRRGPRQRCADFTRKFLPSMSLALFSVLAIDADQTCDQ